MNFFLELLKNSMARYVLVAFLALIVGLTIGNIRGTHQEREKWLKIDLAKKDEIQKIIIAKNIANNKILADKESEIARISFENGKLKGIIADNENYINSTNMLTYDWVRLVSGNGLSKTAKPIIKQDGSVYDGRKLPTGVAKYITDLRAHDASCVAQLNALIDSVK